MSDYEVKVQVWKVTEWRDGCIYKTELCDPDWAWVDMDQRGNTVEKDGITYQYGSFGTSDPRIYDNNIRRKDK